jgi:hypothetical protein
LRPHAFFEHVQIKGYMFYLRPKGSAFAADRDRRLGRRNRGEGFKHGCAGVEKEAVDVVEGLI